GTLSDWFFLEPQRSQQRPRMLLAHRSSFLEQRITGIRSDEPRGMNFHLVAHASDDRRFVTLRARIPIEQWAEAIFGFEDSLENFLPLQKLRPLLRREVRQRFSKSRLLRCLASQN